MCTESWNLPREKSKIKIAIFKSHITHSRTVQADWIRTLIAFGDFYFGLPNEQGVDVKTTFCSHWLAYFVFV